MNYAYLPYSDGDKTLLFIHGWATDSRVFYQQVEYFKTKYGILLVDLMGAEALVSTSDYSESLVELVTKLVLENVVVIGWSLGSLVAIKMATIVPQRVSSLVLISATPKFMSEKNYNCGLSPAVVRQFHRSLERNYEATLTQFYNLMFSKNEQDGGYQALFFSEVLPRMRRLKQDDVIKGLGYLMNTDHRHLLSELACPVTICHGQDDTICPVSAAYFLEKNITASKLVVFEDCGHIPFLTQKTRMNALIAESIVR